MTKSKTTDQCERVRLERKDKAFIISVCALLYTGFVVPVYLSWLSHDRAIRRLEINQTLTTKVLEKLDVDLLELERETRHNRENLIRLQSGNSN